MKEIEIWKDVVGYERIYQVSNIGNVKRVAGSYQNPVDRMLKQHTDKIGRKLVGLYVNSKGKHIRVHRLVALAFIGECPARHEVCHKNGNASDNRVDNLYYGTRSENQKDRAKHGTKADPSKYMDNRGTKCASSILTESQVAEIKLLLKTGLSASKILKKFPSIKIDAIYGIKQGRTWKYLHTEEISKQYLKEKINKQNPIILDIGCYDGKDSNELLSLFGTADIHCFDADPRSQKIFNDKNTNGKKLYPIAISNINGYVDMFQSDSETRRHEGNESWSASSSLMKPKNHLSLFPDVIFEKTIKVKSTTLDKWYSEILIDKNIDLIWIDLNGNELNFIIGGLKTLENYTRYLYIEFSDNELYEGQISKEEILKLLPSFEMIGIYNFQGNFGNILLKNKNL